MKVIESRRQLIPRWHTSRKLARLNLNVGVSPPGESITSESELEGFRFEESLSDWKSKPTLASATELYVKSLLSGAKNEETEKAKNFLLAKKDILSKPLIGLLTPDLSQYDDATLYTTQEVGIHRIITSLKQQRNENPSDSLVWNDLAFYYAALGNGEKSERCMRVSYELSNKNAIIARAYSRLLVHQDDPEKAIQILKATGDLKTNPILLSADIAIKTVFNLGRPDIKNGIRLLEKYHAHPRLISELSASIGSLEMESGASKSAKFHLKTAAISPTENTISQLYWLKHEKHIRMDENFRSLLPSQEAKVIYHYSNDNYLECKNALLELHHFQPFSERPIVDAGYISLVALDDPIEAIRIYEAHPHITKKSFMGTNNYIVALLETGRVAEAADQLAQLKTPKADRDEAVSMATAALYSFKIGDAAAGRALYGLAEQRFSSVEDHSDLGRLYYYYGRQELLLDKQAGISMLEKSRKFLEKTKSNKEILSRINKILKPSEVPNTSQEIKLT